MQYNNNNNKNKNRTRFLVFYHCWSTVRFDVNRNEFLFGVKDLLQPAVWKHYSPLMNVLVPISSHVPILRSELNPSPLHAPPQPGFYYYRLHVNQLPLLEQQIPAQGSESSYRVFFVFFSKIKFCTRSSSVSCLEYRRSVYAAAGALVAVPARVLRALLRLRSHHPFSPPPPPPPPRPLQRQRHRIVYLRSCQRLMPIL